MNKEAPPDCFKCEYREKIPGTAHIRCKHPTYDAVQQGSGGALTELMSIFASVGRSPPMRAISQEIEVVGHHQGIEGGWFNHPFNFDPTWLLKCTGFKEDN